MKLLAVYYALCIVRGEENKVVDKRSVTGERERDCKTCREKPEEGKNGQMDTLRG